MEIYNPKKPIYVTPAGTPLGGCLWGKIRIYGSIGWALREPLILLPIMTSNPGGKPRDS